MNRYDAGGIPPRLLFLCQTLPFPPDGGASIRTYNVLRLLSRDFDITALCFYRRASRSSMSAVSASIDALTQLAKVEAFPIPQEHSRLRLLADHLASLVSRRVYTLPAHWSRRYRQRLLDLIRTERFDLFHVDSLDLSAYLPHLDPQRTVVVHHNVESALLRRRAHAEDSALRKWYLRRQADYMEGEERRWAPRVALNVTVSEADRLELLRIVPTANVAVIANGVDTGAFRPDQLAAGTSLVFVGGHNWFPNRDALDFFCMDILPLIRKRHPHIDVQWVGRAPDSLRSRMKEEYGINMVGYVEDIRPHVLKAPCYVVPLRIGGGTRLKILDAWAMGKAVVSTSVGCEGLDARDGVNILVRDRPEDFANAVGDVLDDTTLRLTLEAGARATALQTYDWDVIGRGMSTSYHRVLARVSVPETDS
jgi:polysaccharide biosynthesis protein PslH